MKIYQYQCTLLTDVVISSSTATEGFKKSLDYIPGAKFLGIAARKLYREEEAIKTLDLFHNGTVRFGDAHPNIEGQYALHIPFSWFYEKHSALDKAIYLHHYLNEDIRGDLLLEGIQLKQARSGYFTTSGKWLQNISQEFSIKSAYDRDKRRSKDEQMYGYFALPQGTKWLFTVEDQKGIYLDEIKAAIQGKHRIGRSRTAEYGLVEIVYDKVLPTIGTIDAGEKVILFAESNLLFYDQFGQSTLQPDPAHDLQLPPSSTIDWERSQVRSRLYQTWNRKRYNRDMDRMIIEKGSVLVCTIPRNTTLPKAIRVGTQQAEGFGKMLVDPSFLESTDYKSNLSLEKINLRLDLEGSQRSSVIAGADDNLIMDFLLDQQSRAISEFNIDREVNSFVHQYQSQFQGITSSQWGMVRSYAKHASALEAFEKLLFEEGFGCLTKGQSEKDWRKKGRRDTLYEYLFKLGKIPKADIIPFTIKLSAEMAKANKK